ncbi:DoxX family protein [Christiangramia sabulilitoris]|uniref:DoxX family protein n=1 Tax=Christiangramia sabulilitoris TaxID=2583991 RepID=A0A550I8S4_9FLAO|nr:DoxX family protein [Christiangramia sabulilitoris]TRO67373.1 DoxX family protein [Christiangramia sabulilitoris]
MDSISTNFTELLILVFILITFLQSGIDKATDWGGNTGWLKDHFSGTFLSGMVPLMVGIILIIEVITGLMAILAIWWLIAYGDTSMTLYTCVLACVTLLMLLFGQRVAKDYAGAFTLTGYFIVCMFGVYITS